MECTERETYTDKMVYNQTDINITDVVSGEMFCYCVVVGAKLVDNTKVMLIVNQETIRDIKELCSFTKNVNDYAMIFILLLGIPGNILSLLTIRTLPLSTGTFYVALLSIADFSTLLLSGIFFTLRRLDTFATAVCKLQDFLIRSTSTYAHWTLVLITFERYFTVRFPLQKSYYFTIRRARISALVLGAVVPCLFVAHLWTNEFDGEKCSVRSETTDLIVFLNDLNMVIYSILPFALLFILVVATAVELRKIQADRRRFMGEACLSSGSASCVQVEKHLLEQSRIEHCITLMLFFSATVFIILTLPVCVGLVMFNTSSSMDPLQNARVRVAHVIAAFLSSCLHACNFFIYFLSARRFREQLYLVLHCRALFNKNDRSSDTDNEALRLTQDVPLTNTSSY